MHAKVTKVTSNKLQKNEQEKIWTRRIAQNIHVTDLTNVSGKPKRHKNNINETQINVELNTQ